MHSTKRIKILIIIFVILIFPMSIFSQSNREIVASTFPSVVLLVMEDNNGQPISLGSGFFVKKNLIATNFHVVEGASSGYAKIIGKQKKYEIKGIVGLDKKRDLVILEVNSLKITPLKLGNVENIAIGDEIFAIGNPKGLEGTFSKGIVSGMRQVGSDSLMQITAPISPGSSGGPVLDNHGIVVGIAVATFKGGQNLNFAIPVSYLKELLNHKSSIQPLSVIKNTATSKSILHDLGGNSTESVIASHFLWNDYSFRGKYTFSVRNSLRESIKNIVCLIIFYADDGLPIETETIVIRGPIRGKLAKRSQESGRSKADEVRNLTKKIEMRVLDFQLLK